MKKNSNSGSKKNDDLEIAPFTAEQMRRGVMGKYYRQVAERSRRVIGLDPDVARVFKNSESVNKVLRAIIATLPPAEKGRRKSA